MELIEAEKAMRKNNRVLWSFLEVQQGNESARSSYDVLYLARIVAYSSLMARPILSMSPTRGSEDSLRGDEEVKHLVESAEQ